MSVVLSRRDQQLFWEPQQRLPDNFTICWVGPFGIRNICKERCGLGNIPPPHDCSSAVLKIGHQGPMARCKCVHRAWRLAKQGGDVTSKVVSIRLAFIRPCSELSAHRSPFPAVKVTRGSLPGAAARRWLRDVVYPYR